MLRALLLFRPLDGSDLPCPPDSALMPRSARASSRQSPGRSWSRFVDQAGAFQTHRSPCSARQPWSRAYGPAEGGATGGVAAVDFVGPVPDPAAGVGVDLQQQFRNRSGAAIRRPWRRSRASRRIRTASSVCEDKGVVLSVRTMWTKMIALTVLFRLGSPSYTRKPPGR